MFWLFKKMQKVYFLLKAYLKPTKRQLPYGITQCYLPPDTGEHALPQPNV